MKWVLAAQQQRAMPHMEQAPTSDCELWFFSTNSHLWPSSGKNEGRCLSSARDTTH